MARSIEITDAFMRDMMTRTRAYTIVLLRKTANRAEPGADTIVWEHGRRNFQLRAEGKLAIVCPIGESDEWAGVAIYDAEPAEVRRLMEGDPGVQAGIFTYEILPTRSFPGDHLPG
jgi:hypothetical protein